MKLFVRAFGYITTLCIFLLAGLILMNPSKKETIKEENKIVEKEKTIKKDILTKVKEFEKNQKNTEDYLYTLENNKYLKAALVSNYYTKRFDDLAYVINVGKSKNVNVVALGTDEKYHLSNYYLEGFAPYKTEKIWTPLMVLAKKKTYQLDHLGKLKKKEIWQRSSEAFKLPRGDCEDHAIALTDWLIQNKEDARVVIGDYDGEGHAWVVLFKNNKQYIIEATAKKGIQNAFMNAKLATKYRPKAMFNQNYYWYNKGSIYTTNYKSNKWVKKSQYLRKEI